MTRQPAASRILALALSLSAAALVLTAGLPHRHDGAATAHPSHACRVCKLHDAFSAAPPASAKGAPATPVVEVRLASIAESPRAVQVVRSTPPRAPPFSS